MRVKKWACLLVAILLLASLVGCGGAGSPSSESDAQTSGPDPLETSATVEPKYPNGQLRFYGWHRGVNWFTLALDTNAGLYEIVPYAPDENTSQSQLWLTDYTTREYRILCDDPACVHSGESCLAWLPGYSGNYTLLEAAGKLVLVDKGYQEYIYPPEGGTPQGATYIPAVIYTMGYDGKSRVPLCTFGEREVLEGEWYTDDTYLYGIRTRYPEDITAKDMDYIKTRTVVKVNLTTGEISDLCELDPREEGFVGTLDGKLLTRCAEYPIDNHELMGEENHAAWEQNMQRSWVSQYTIDTQTGERTKLPREYPNIGFGGSALEGEYFYYNAVEDYVYNQGIESVGPTPQSVYKVHLPTGETTEIFTGVQGENVNTGGVIDGKLFVTTMNQTQGESKYLWVDVATGEQMEQKLYFTPQMGTEVDRAEAAGMEVRSPVVPQGEAGEYYLVTMGQRVVEGEYAGAATALILKEDYWAGKENYLPIIYTT